MLRLSLRYRKDVALHNAILSDQLLPQIQSQLRSGMKKSHHRSIISLALKQWKEEQGIMSGNHTTPEFLKIVEAQLKVFTVAGHDTTAQAM
jgi:hypothetical protein